MLRVFAEKSRSRSGYHQLRRMFMVVDNTCKELDFKIVSREKVKPLYSRGDAEEITIEAPENGYILQLMFVLGMKKKVKGEILVFDANGELLGRAVYRKLKVRLVDYLSPSLIDIIKCAFTKLKLPVKKYAIIRK